MDDYTTHCGGCRRQLVTPRELSVMACDVCYPSPHNDDPRNDELNYGPYSGL